MHSLYEGRRAFAHALRSANSPASQTPWRPAANAAGSAVLRLRICSTHASATPGDCRPVQARRSRPTSVAAPASPRKGAFGNPGAAQWPSLQGLAWLQMSSGVECRIVLARTIRPGVGCGNASARTLIMRRLTKAASRKQPQCLGARRRGSWKFTTTGCQDSSASAATLATRT